MKIEEGRRYAVLTGDIVQSKKLRMDERRELANLLERVGKDLCEWSWAPLPLDRYRGDGWQVVIADPRRALRAGLYVRAALRSGFEGRRLDTRVAIGVGTIDFITQDHVAEGDGEAYRLSGAAIDERGWRRLRFAGAPGVSTTTVQVMLDLVDFIAKEWTSAQAVAVAGALRGWTQEQTATRWVEKPITQQGVAHHLSRAGWDAVESALTWFEEQIQP